jgi:hypothetical protein
MDSETFYFHFYVLLACRQAWPFNFDLYHSTPFIEFAQNKNPAHCVSSRVASRVDFSSFEGKWPAYAREIYPEGTEEIFSLQRQVLDGRSGLPAHAGPRDHRFRRVSWLRSQLHGSYRKNGFLPCLVGG